MSTTIKKFFDRQKRDLSDKSNKDDEGHVVLVFYIASCRI